jgi:hypothetical protein
MKPPKCRSCGTEHWGSVCQEFIPVQVAKAVKTEQKATAKSEPDQLVQIQRPESAPSKALFDRSAYQRRYMADLRTIKRLGLSVTVAQYRKSKET